MTCIVLRRSSGFVYTLNDHLDAGVDSLQGSEGVHCSNLYYTTYRFSLSDFEERILETSNVLNDTAESLSRLPSAPSNEWAWPFAWALSLSRHLGMKTWNHF